MARTIDRSTPSPLPEKIGALLQESRWLGVGAIALFLCMALWGFNKEDPGWSHAVVGQSLHNPAGRAGAWIADLMLYIFGLSAWWWIVLLGMFVWWGVRRLHTWGRRTVVRCSSRWPVSSFCWWPVQRSKRCVSTVSRRLCRLVRVVSWGSR